MCVCDSYVLAFGHVTGRRGTTSEVPPFGVVRFEIERETEGGGECEGGWVGWVGGGEQRKVLRGKWREREGGACLPMCRVSCKCEPISVGLHRMCVCM
jgi:hypothetical protein